MVKNRKETPIEPKKV